MMIRNLRRIVSMLVVVVLLLVGTVGYCDTSEENEEVYFEATLTNILDMQAKEWFASSYYRAVLTVMVAGDLALACEDGSFDLATAITEDTYVGKEGLDLIVYFHGVDEDIIVVYRPLTGDACYLPMEEMSSEYVEYILGELCTEGFYLNDMEDIFEVVADLQEVLAS